MPRQPTADRRQAAMAAALGIPLPEAGQWERDRTMLRDQLGREPQGSWLVASRDGVGRPRVMATYPLLLDATGRSCRPFPNMLWLTDIALSRAISELERTGHLARLQADLAADAALAHQLAGDHASHAATRWAMLLEEDRLLAHRQGWEEELRHRGIGGLASTGTRLKCLHAHVAHHLVMGSAVGARVMAMLKSQASV